MDAKLKEIFYDPTSIAGFSTPRKLYNEARHRGYRVKYNDVKEWLRGQPTYTLHKPRRINFRRRRTYVSGINDLHQADLADMSNIASPNDGFRYLLVVIDCFTKFARVVPLKNKQSATVLEALKTVFQAQQPKNFQTDNGKEFVNALLYDYCKSKGINAYTTRNRETKASIAERFIRTLKSKIYKYLTHNNTKRYIDKLDVFVDAYNNTKNSFGFVPAHVTKENEEHVRIKLFPAQKHTIVYEFNIGDLVRISKEKQPFDRGFHQLWSLEVFTINKQFAFDPPVYELIDANGESIIGRFYGKELQKVKLIDDTYQIEKILRKRKGKHGVEYLVKWLGYPKLMNSWVKEDEMVSI